MPAEIHTTISVSRKSRQVPCSCFCIGFILTFAFFNAAARAEDPPPDLAQRIMWREGENQIARNNYTYRQTVTIDELDNHGLRVGEYREVRDIIFSPLGERTEQLLSKPSSTLKRLQLTDQDFQDIRSVQPFLLTNDTKILYETKFKGEETIDGMPCWVLQVEPRQILEGQRLFEGLVWADKKDFSIVRSEGQAVPQIVTTKSENLFPHFTTIRQKVDGKYWFPVETYADDTLYFRNGPQRIKLIIRYANYKHFAADSVIHFDK